MKYIEKFGGYIADNPNIEIALCNGHVYSYDEVNTASMTNNSETIEITGGQGNFPLAVLDTTKTLEFTFESSEFTLDMFAMANDVETKVEEEYSVMTSKRYEVSSDLTIEITDKIDGEIFINGFEKGDAVGEGVFKVTDPGTDGDPTVITFNTGDVVEGDTIRVAYKRVIADASVVSVLTNSHTAKGSLTATWPVQQNRPLAA